MDRGAPNLHERRLCAPTVNDEGGEVARLAALGDPSFRCRCHWTSTPSVGVDVGARRFNLRGLQVAHLVALSKYSKHSRAASRLPFRLARDGRRSFPRRHHTPGFAFSARLELGGSENGFWRGTTLGRRSESFTFASAFARMDGTSGARFPAALWNLSPTGSFVENRWN